MRKAKSWYSELVRNVLALALSIALVLEGIPATPTLAEELNTALEGLEQVEGQSQNDEGQDGEGQNGEGQDGEGQDGVGQNGEITPGEETPVKEDESPSDELENNASEETKLNDVKLNATGTDDALLAAQDETSTVPTSTTFTLQAVANNVTRSSKVTFVDTDGNPIKGTIIGAVRVSYTGSGTESNATNTIDLYSFQDKLDPAIADEYEFSRVYVQLTNDQKDFRRVMVGDNTSIGNSSANPCRAYFFMNDVSENAAGQVYNGMWYQLTSNGIMNDIYIEFYHVASASFRAIDTRNDPVQGAVFTLYTDPGCYNPLEYKGEEVTAVSNRRGVVTFGKIPCGTYYMKETVVPDGYKKSTAIYKVEIDGETAIADVVHEDDDGSIIIADVLEMTLTKKWNDEKPHLEESVEVTIYTQDEVVATVTLNADNDWTETVGGLDPNEAYMVSETSVTSNGVDVTQSWIPEIEYEEKDLHPEYYKSGEFRKGGQYVLMTTTYSGTRALSGGSSLTTVPVELSDDASQVVGEMSSDVVWYVENITQDGVIALQNVGSGKYLDQNNKWYLNPEYPAPLLVRHSNDNGNIRFYYRENKNAAVPYYLYVWYGPNKEGQVDRYQSDASQAGVFELYRRVNVHSVDVTITNKATEYPIRIKNVTYPQGEALPAMSFDLYWLEDYSDGGSGVPLMSGLTANSEGYLENEAGSSLLELSAGQYVLVQTSTLEDEGYAPLTMPIKFTITRGGTLKVAQNDQEFLDFAYSTTMAEGEKVIPVLQVPNNRPATFELTLDVQGEYADLTRAFAFEIAIPEGAGTLKGSIDGEAVMFDEDNYTFELRAGQTLRLEGVPAAEEYVFTQVDSHVAAVKQEGDGLYEASVQVTPAAGTQSAVTVMQSAEDARVVVLSGLRGADDDPARVTITNTFSAAEVPQTGLVDNTGAWTLMVGLCVGALAGLFVYRRRVRA